MTDVATALLALITGPFATLFQNRCPAMKPVNRRVALASLILLPWLIAPGCCLTPQLAESIGDTASDIRFGICDPVGDTGRAVGNGALALGQIALLPVAIVADVVIVPPIHVLWIIATAGGHGQPPFGCR